MEIDLTICVMKGLSFLLTVCHYANWITNNIDIPVKETNVRLSVCTRNFTKLSQSVALGLTPFTDNNGVYRKIKY